jgi:hypothetical protein
LKWLSNAQQLKIYSLMMMGIEVWGPMHKSAVKNSKFLSTADAQTSTLE